MKYNLHDSTSASEDFDGIYNYIKTELDSPFAAEDIINQILDKIERLQNYPVHKSGSDFSQSRPHVPSDG